MRISVMVDFEVTPNNGEDEITDQQAISAVDYIIYNHLVLTENGHTATDEAETHVDGFGSCLVRLADDLS
jgi:hypothetical protein